MYAYVIKPDGSYYTSLVFGYDLFEYSQQKLHQRYYLVLNEARTALVRHRILPDCRPLKLHAVATDMDRPGWYMPSPTFGCVPFLRSVDLSARELAIPPELTQRCIDLDAAHVQPEVFELLTDEDGADLRLLAGNFHDAFVEKTERRGDTVYVQFSNCWGYRLEMWFEGDAGFHAPGPTELTGFSPDWFSSTLRRENGLWYLIDEEGITAGEITAEHNWFCGRNAAYRLRPS